MDWNRYKQICDTPTVFSRWMLEQSGELLAPTLRARLLDQLAQGALVKPPGHSGGVPTDMFELSLTLEEANNILNAIQAAAANGTTTSGTRDRGLGGFEAAWQEYRDFLEAGAGVS